jgi:excisionase family DNA binding protein
MESKLLLSAEEAADMLAIGRSKVFEMMASGELESFTIGRRRVLPVAGLREFVERQRQGQEKGEGA